MRRSLLQLAILAIAVPAHAGGGETIMPPPPTYEANGVTVEEHLGARLPADAMFRTADNTVTTLGALLAEADTPVILTFNYADCPLLCSMQLNGLTAAMPLRSIRPSSACPVMPPAR